MYSWYILFYPLRRSYSVCSVGSPISFILASLLVCFQQTKNMYKNLEKYSIFTECYSGNIDRLCGLVVRVPGYRS
jgi:hypothetical protein